MTKKSKTIIFFGNERLATGVSTNTPTLIKLINSGYKILKIVVNNEPSKSRRTRDLEILEVAKKYNIPVLSPRRLIDIKDDLVKSKADVGVLVAYGKMVPNSVINLFPKGIINIHPSLLPKHRGPTPIESVILNGESKTGVSLMKLEKAMDAGPIYAQETIKLNGNESKQELADLLLDTGSNMLINNLDNILNGSIEAFKQIGDATYDNLILKSDGKINWHDNASTITRKIRAYQSWPNSYTSINGLDLIINSATIVNTSLKPGEIQFVKDGMIIGCNDKGISIDNLKPAGKKDMDIRQFIAGYKNTLLTAN